MATRSQLDVVRILADLASQGLTALSSADLAREAGVSTATMKRHLDALLAQGRIVRTGLGPATRYHLADNRSAPPAPSPPIELPARQPIQPPAEPRPTIEASPTQWSAEAAALSAYLARPVGERQRVGYRREWLDQYQPNETRLLPAELSEELQQLGRLHEQLPAGTFMRKVLEQLLVDLSWWSSKLEGNRYSLLATEQLFRLGREDADPDAAMLLNHRDAIQFLVDTVPTHGMSTSLVRNLHAVLMRDLLPDPAALGTFRTTAVGIGLSAYQPMQGSSQLEELFNQVIRKAEAIRNPIEAAFFLWVHIAYLQAFEDGNKRTGRLAANIPLMLHNCAPLSFLDVDTHDYATAMLGVYERQDPTIAIELFSWTYRRSITKYGAAAQSAGVPDPQRLRHRESLNAAIDLIVRQGQTMDEAIQGLGLDADVVPGFQALLLNELRLLGPFNSARYRLSTEIAQRWIDAGRPR